MKVFDLFFYITYRFLNMKLGKDEESSRWSASIHLGLFSSFLFNAIICTIGILSDNLIIDFFRQNEIIVIMSALVFFILFSAFRYSKVQLFEKIEKDYLSKTHSQQKIITWLVGLSMLIIPVLYYIALRIFKYGYV